MIRNPILRAVKKISIFIPLKLSGIFLILNSPSISFMIVGSKYFTHVRGIGVGAFGTGIAYLESPPEKIYPGLDAMSDDAREVEGFVGYGPISGNWYYFLWEAD